MVRRVRNDEVLGEMPARAGRESVCIKNGQSMKWHSCGEYKNTEMGMAHQLKICILQPRHCLVLTSKY